MLMSSIPKYDEDKEGTTETGDTFKHVENVEEVLPFL